MKISRRTLLGSLTTGALLLGAGRLSLAADATKKAAKKRGRVTGKVASVDASGKSFVVESRKGDKVTVTTTDKTEFKKGEKAEAAAFGDVKVGERVLVVGERTNDKIVATRVTIGPARKKQQNANKP